MYSWERSRFFTFTELPVGFLMIPANLSGMKKAHRWSPWQSWPWHGKDFTRNLVAWTTCLSKSLRNSTTQTMVIHSFYPWQTLSTTLDIRFHIIEKLGRSELENSVRAYLVHILYILSKYLVKRYAFGTRIRTFLVFIKKSRNFLSNCL